MFCLALVARMVIVHAAGFGTEWQVFAGDCMTAVTLLLLALLKNSELRAERAIQRKLDAIASALPCTHLYRVGTGLDTVWNHHADRHLPVVGAIRGVGAPGARIEADLGVGLVVQSGGQPIAPSGSVAGPLAHDRPPVLVPARIG
ncbi:hypothetical protein SAMN06272765_7564 [Streptomyces sp. Ag109_G2-15]|nr:hypothetical protein SAMN06272765_7564 [Streptomyces sp. Ag109_G2-15]